MPFKWLNNYYNAHKYDMECQNDAKSQKLILTFTFSLNPFSSCKSSKTLSLGDEDDEEMKKRKAQK
ncbi:hypothetical protein ES332_A01G267100v1 [Gossypium tomentosum]|uniref:Uncharacterized protein n=1 Tax=Gossypium tomentosum TaxID=34277 RepID=A0A5D2RVF0_GOSTO|nr:hypothetical protein ES332_A01G267100v1 [Gossypium tomentosum]TYI44848.1 hypothetical protein ES332_A01G267100v1 [Gossypium tomentosum]